jgi:hypothetical protein
MLIQQVSALEGRPGLAEVVGKTNDFLDAVKHSIVLLQIAKVRITMDWSIGIGPLYTYMPCL